AVCRLPRTPALTWPIAVPYKPPDFARSHRSQALGARFSAEPIPACRAIRRFIGEADLSTQQAGAQASPWLPRPHGDQGRPQSDRRAPRAGAQTAERLIASLARLSC